MKITKRQVEVYDAIRKYWQEEGIPPSANDLAAVLDVTRWTIYDHLKSLAKKGLITYDGSRRSIKLTGMQLTLPTLNIRDEDEDDTDWKA